MEALIVRFLASHANSPSWEDIVSFVNEHHQTLAHLAVLFRYTTLLEKVAQWGIDVDVQDVNGFTALHCAYLCGDLDSVGILKGYGADEDIQDDLGRRPVDMYIPRMNDLNERSPSSHPTSGSPQMPSSDEEDWEKVSIASSQPDSFGDYRTTMDSPPSGHQQLHTRDSTTISSVIPASISMPSFGCGTSFATGNEGWIDGVSGLVLSDSPISLERSPPSTPFPDMPAAHLCLSSAGSCRPAAACHSMLTRPTECDHAYPKSFNPTPARVYYDNHTPGTPLPPLIASLPMPGPSSFQHDTPAYPPLSLLDPHIARSSPPASFHPPGTGVGLSSRPGSRLSSTGSPTTRRFDPPPHPPPATPGSSLMSASAFIYSDARRPASAGDLEI